MLVRNRYAAIALSDYCIVVFDALAPDDRKIATKTLNGKYYLGGGQYTEFMTRVVLLPEG